MNLRLVSAYVAAIRRSASWPAAAAAAAAIGLVAYLWFYGHRFGLDLQVYRDGVDAWVSGLNPYLLMYTQHHLPFTYPPFSLFALSPLAWPAFPVAQWLLWAASLGAAVGGVVLVLRDMGAAVTWRLVCGAFAWSCVCLLALEPARSAIDYGQVELILMFVVAADLLAVESPCRGIGIGLAAAVKLTPLAFVIVLAVSKDVKSVLRAAASFAVCAGLSWLWRPDASRTFWFHDVGNPTRVGPVASGANENWYAIVHRPPFPAGGSEAAWVLLSLLTLAVGTFIAWRSVAARRTAPAVIAIALASLLVSPVSWSHHWVWVLLVAALLVGDRRARASALAGGTAGVAGLPRSVRIMLCGLIAVTVVAPYWWFSHGVAADIAEAVLPLWAAAVLFVWCAAEFSSWRRTLVPSSATGPAPLAAPIRLPGQGLR